MVYIKLLLFTLCLSTSIAKAQQFEIPSLSALEDSLEYIKNISDSELRTAHLNNFWDSLIAHQMIPYTDGVNAVFMYRSKSNLTWNGDFNRWGSEDNIQPQSIAGTDLWIAKETYPSDARLDYKIVVGGNWILDPNNPYQQWGGFGPNSELRMPDYEIPPEVIVRNDINKGTLSENITIQSEFLGAAIQYKVYTPFGYESEDLQNLPVVYVTDGHEYSDPRLGNMPVVLDNLIYDEDIPAVIAVFIDPRVNGTNMREQYYTLDPGFADFVVKELIPEIENSYKAAPTADARAILGTSLGGLNSAYFALTYPEVFDNIAMHSPAIAYEGEIQYEFEQADHLPPNFYIGTGSINDNSFFSKALADFLISDGYNVMYTEIPQSHSWGNWKGLIDEPLIFFWDHYTYTVSNENESDLPDHIHISNYPNPFNPTTTIQVKLNEAALIDLEIFNNKGQLIQTVAKKTTLTTGTHSFSVDLSGFASGHYFYRVRTSDVEVINQMTLIK